MFKGIRQVRLLRSATTKFHSGAGMESVLEDVFEYYGTDPIFFKIMDQFHATADDIGNIILDSAVAGAGGTYHGHFVPVSAVLYPPYPLVSAPRPQRRGEESSSLS
jgi:hypothetical protein